MEQHSSLPFRSASASSSTTSLTALSNSTASIRLNETTQLNSNGEIVSHEPERPLQQRRSWNQEDFKRLLMMTQFSKEEEKPAAPAKSEPSPYLMQRKSWNQQDFKRFLLIQEMTKKE